MPDAELGDMRKLDVEIRGWAQCRGHLDQEIITTQYGAMVKCLKSHKGSSVFCLERMRET